MDKLSWKNIFKSWTGVPVLILVVLAVVWLFTNGLPGYKTWQAKRAYDKLSEPYYNDTYGGKTPEETYDLFIDALKKGDVELASKYFELSDQSSWEKVFIEYKKAGILNEYIAEIESNRKNWRLEESNDTSTTYLYSYTRKESETIELPIEDGVQKIVLPPGTFNAQVAFSKNGGNNIWKISDI